MKKIIVKGCADCPYFDAIFCSPLGIDFYRFPQSQLREIKDNPEFIPDWCPLKDVKD